MRLRESLSRIPLFEGLTEAEIGRLDSQCAWRRYDEAERILNFNDPGHEVFFVVQGRVRVSIQLKDDKDTILVDLADGDVFGELSAIDKLPRSAGIDALSACNIAKMPAAVFLDVIHRHPAVCDRVLQLLAQRVRATGARVAEFRSLNVQHRLFMELLRLAKLRPSEPNVAAISPPPYHQEIADRISARREAVSREIKALERAGIVDRRKGALVICDVEALKRSVGLAHV